MNFYGSSDNEYGNQCDCAKNAAKKKKEANNRRAAAIYDAFTTFEVRSEEMVKFVRSLNLTPYLDKKELTNHEIGLLLDLSHGLDCAIMESRMKLIKTLFGVDE